jgi:hypothetical protein
MIVAGMDNTNVPFADAVKQLKGKAVWVRGAPTTAQAGSTPSWASQDRS